MENERIETQLILINSIRLNVALAGPPSGEPVMLLHGFPDAWFGWRGQIVPLAAAGLQVIAPDQRGYNLSDKPEKIEDYRIELLVRDVIDLADQLGHKRFSLAGHDWGAAVAWMTAICFPERIRKLAILNVPHPRVFRQFIRSSLEQRLKSWYMLFFQLPRIPEILLSANNWQNVLNQMPELSAQERVEYTAAWSQPRAITCMLNWYRANVRGGQSRAQSPPERVIVPTLLIWGEKDRYLSAKMAEPSCQLCDQSRLVMLPNATHWVMHDERQKVSELLLSHFGPQDSS